MRPQCILSAPPMHPLWLPNAPQIRPQSVSNASQMYSWCVLNSSLMRPQCPSTGTLKNGSRWKCGKNGVEISLFFSGPRVLRWDLCSFNLQKGPRLRRKFDLSQRRLRWRWMQKKSRLWKRKSVQRKKMFYPMLTSSWILSTSKYF